MRLKHKIQQRLSELGIDPKRSLGQNFLISDEKLDQIVSKVRQINPSAGLIELGPGLGSLTDELLQIDPYLQLIELDRTFADFWRNQGLQVFEIDGLKLDWTLLVREKKGSYLLVSNLPYQISASIVIDRCFGPEEITDMILMFQKEVAQRITAVIETKDYGLLSVLAQNFFEIKRVTDLGPRCYYPAPKVESRVLHFRRKQGVLPDSGFLNFCKQAFSHRRKLLIKNLSAWVNQNAISDELKEIFVEFKINPLSRAENLSPQQFQDLYFHLLNNKQSSGKEPHEH